MGVTTEYPKDLRIPSSVMFDAEVGFAADVVAPGVMEKALRDYIDKGGGVVMEGDSEVARRMPVGFLKSVRAEDNGLVCSVTVYDDKVKGQLAELVRAAPTKMRVYPTVMRFRNAPDEVTSVSIGMERLPLPKVAFEDP